MLNRLPGKRVHQSIHKSRILFGCDREELLAERFHDGLIRTHSRKVAVEVPSFREPSPGKERVARQVAMMGFQGICTPEENQIRPVAHLVQKRESPAVSFHQIIETLNTFKGPGKPEPIQGARQPPGGPDGSLVQNVRSQDQRGPVIAQYAGSLHDPFGQKRWRERLRAVRVGNRCEPFPARLAEVQGANDLSLL